MDGLFSLLYHLDLVKRSVSLVTELAWLPAMLSQVSLVSVVSSDDSAMTNGQNFVPAGCSKVSGLAEMPY